MMQDSPYGVASKAEDSLPFWLGHFEFELPQDGEPVPGAPLLAGRQVGESGPLLLVVEVIEESREQERWTVLLSTQRTGPAQALTCCIGFSNSPSVCDRWRDDGFRVVEAQISLSRDRRTLTVVAPYFPSTGGPGEAAMRLDDTLLKISGLHLPPSPPSDTLSANEEANDYEQASEAADDRQPDLYVASRRASWRFRRLGVVRLMRAAAPVVEVKAARHPSLLPFGGPIQARCVQQRRGWVRGRTPIPEVPPPRESDGKSQAQDRSQPTDVRAGPQRMRRDRLYGDAAFRFEDVELLGFRIDLDEHGEAADRLLERLVAPLNFHLLKAAAGDDDARALSDFCYRPASRTISIELLRYGKMKLDRAVLPFRDGDYQFQHELLVRVLVGRVDDDTSQAHDPAVFVPVLFVDNPWSKVLGREVQGFDKQLADFMAPGPNGSLSSRRPLRCDGRLQDGGERVPLTSIAGVSLVSRMGTPGSSPLLDIDGDFRVAEDLDAFVDVDLRLAVGSSALGGTRWRQQDFDAAEFRRSFARTVVTRDLLGFKSIQVSPVGNRDLPKTWITGDFVFDDLQAVRPRGSVSLQFHPLGAEGDSASESAWNRLVHLLGDGAGVNLTIASGDWYRIRCNMSFTLDDGLNW